MSNLLAFVWSRQRLPLSAAGLFYVSGIVMGLMARRLAYWLAVMPCSDFFGLSSLYSSRYERCSVELIVATKVGRSKEMRAARGFETGAFRNSEPIQEAQIRNARRVRFAFFLGDFSRAVMGSGALAARGWDSGSFRRSHD
jgi:hypothetical protein